MKNKLISFILVLCLLIAIPLEARYKYNPFTRKLDYYETGADIDLGDLADVTLTGLATGNVLYYDGSAWVNLATGANTQFLTLAAGIPAWQAIPAGVTTFVGLNDTPANYVGKAGQLVRVNAGANALEFFAGSPLGTVIIADGAGGWTKTENYRVSAAGAVTLGSWTGTAIANGYVAGIDQNLLQASTPTFNDLTISIPSNIYALSHDSFANWAANKHVVLPGTLANVLTDHNLLAHTTLGLFDASSDVDHNQTTNYDANRHTDHTAVSVLSAGLISGGGTIDGNQTLTLTEATIESAIDTLGAVQFTGDVEFLEDIAVTWADSADHMVIDQGSESGTENQALIRISDAREGATVDEVEEATIYITSEGWGLGVIAKAYFQGDFQVDGDSIFTQDFFVTWDSAGDHMAITQSSESGTEGQALVEITDAREGATVSSEDEASLRITGEGFGLSVIAKSYFEGDIEITEDFIATWGSNSDHLEINMTNVTGVSNQGLITISDARTGEYADATSEASLIINPSGVYALFIADGTSYFSGDIYSKEDFEIFWSDAADHMVIAQTDTGGTSGQPLIDIDDDRTGEYADSLSEATIVLNAAGAYAFYVQTGEVYFAQRTTLTDEVSMDWTEASDYLNIYQASETQTEDVALVTITSEAEGATVDEPSEALLKLVTENYNSWAFYAQTGIVEIGDDFLLNWSGSLDHAVITQTDTTGTDGQPLISIDDDRTGAYANAVAEATLVIDAAGSYAFYIQTGQAYFDGNVTFTENIEVNWADAADHMTIHQASATQTENTPLVSITSEAEGATVDENIEALLKLSTEQPVSWALYAQNGIVEYGDNVYWNWAEAADHAVIAQAAVAGIEDQPLIYIDDDRTGTTADEPGEASLVITADGAYAFYAADGATRYAEMLYADGLAGGLTITDSDGDSTLLIGWHGDDSPELQPGGNATTVRIDGAMDVLGNFVMKLDDQWVALGAGTDFILFWDTNGTGDDLAWFAVNDSGAGDTQAVWFADWSMNPNNMADHDDYSSMTWVMPNDQGADAGDYAGVVIGERAQANVKVAHYFDFYAMTGSYTGGGAPGDELPAIFRFGASGSAVPGYAITPGDVLFEGSIEIDGNEHIAGYHRSAYTKWEDCFDHGSTAAKYGQDWDITSLNTQGSGSNTIQTNPGNITMTTEANGVGDNEGTRTDYQIVERGSLNRTEIGVTLGQTVNTQFYFGWNDDGLNAMQANADKYVIVFFDVSDDANWQIKVGDGTTEDVFTSSVAADTSYVSQEIWVEADGTVHWCLNGVELDITGSVDNKMAADDHYLIVGQVQSVTGAAAIMADIGFVENEKLKDH